MDKDTHYHMHETIRTLYEDGLAVSGLVLNGNGNDADNAQCDVSAGEIHDEDIRINILGKF